MIPTCIHGLGPWHWLADIGTFLAMIGSAGVVFWACCKAKFNGMFRRKVRSTMTEDQIQRILERRT